MPLEQDPADLISTLMQSRQTILPARLLAPGPDAQQLRQILGAAASAPDHRQLLPWRFVLVPVAARKLLAEQFAIALQERDAQALPEQVEEARAKAFRAPCLLLLVVDLARGDPSVDGFERVLSAGAAAQNVLLMATALGFASALTSGRALKARGMRALFSLSEEEYALCFVSLGTAQTRKPMRLRPTPEDYVSQLLPDGNVVPGAGF
jgi:nitroreductase